MCISGWFVSCTTVAWKALAIERSKSVSLCSCKVCCCFLQRELVLVCCDVDNLLSVIHTTVAQSYGVPVGDLVELIIWLEV